jgi:hypothetical protein
MAPLALAPVASPIWPIPVPAVPSHDDKPGFAPPRDTAALCRQSSTAFSRKEARLYDIASQFLRLFAFYVDVLYDNSWSCRLYFPSLQQRRLITKDDNTRVTHPNNHVLRRLNAHYITHMIFHMAKCFD